MKELNITASSQGQRLDRYLMRVLPQAQTGFLYKMMRKKNITLNGKRCTGTEHLSAGDTVRIFFSDETFEQFSRGSEAPKTAPVRDNLQIIYEDENVCFINKRAGELSQKARPSDISLVELLLAHVRAGGLLSPEELKACHPAVCNRLDRNTTGLVACGLSVSGLQYLSEVIRDRTVKKEYLALAAGQITEPFYVKGWLVKDEKTNTVRVTKDSPNDPDAVMIETGVTPLSSTKTASLLLIHLVTGKSHQIRAHLASLGHPIIGDPKYGNARINAEFVRSCHLQGQLLHAYRMTFPKTDGPFAYLAERPIMAPVPPVFQKACAFANVTLPKDAKGGAVCRPGTPAD